MTIFRRFIFFLWYFGHFKIPLIGYLRPKLIALDDKQVIIKIHLSRRSKNHLNSMYFGALSIGADLAGGLHGYYYADKLKLRISLAFKSFEAKFLKRPETHVYFISQSGDEIKTMIEESHTTGRRINKHIAVQALVNYPENPEEIAQFKLELSLKVV